MLRSGSDVDRCVLRVYPTRQQQAFYVVSNGEYWRLYEFVNDTRTVQRDAPDAEIDEADYGFGEFVSSLSDLPWKQLPETIPHFHHGPKRYEALQDAIRRDLRGRKTICEDEIDAINGQRSLLVEPQLRSDLGMLPRRGTHKDAKCSNILINGASLKSQRVIDLDTVMCGFALYDFGDLVRTPVSGVDEDEADPAKARVQLPRLECAARGFIDGTGGSLTPDEARSLAIGPKYMALIKAVRFLTDYLQGDLYYRVLDSDHYLGGCRTQLALVKSLYDSREDIDELIGTLSMH